MWPAWLVLVGLALPAPARAWQQADPTAASDEPSAQTEGLLPVPEYAGVWTQRPALTGAWGGARQDLADKGVTFGLEWLQVGQGVVSGGSDQRWAYASNIDYLINLDLMRMGVVPGALVSFRAQSRFGDTINADTGQLLPVNTYSYFPLTSPADADVPFAVTELNWTQFFSERWALQAGKVTTMRSSNEFAGGEGRSQFMNFQFSYSAVLAQVAPYSTLALGGVWIPSEHVTVSSVLMNTTDASTTTGFEDIGDGTSWAALVDTQHRIGRKPGGMNFTGVWAFDGDFARIGGINIDPGGDISLETANSAWSAYWSGWQYFHTEGDSSAAIDPGDGRQDLQGIGVFALLGLADKDTNPVAWSGTVGLSGRGTIGGRDDDTWGVGYFFNGLQNLSSVIGSQLEGSVQGTEGYYNIALTSSMALTLDLQWVDSALPGIDDSVIAAARLNVSF